MVSRRMESVKTDVDSNEKRKNKNTIDSISTCHNLSKQSRYRSRKGSVAKIMHRRVISNKLPAVKDKYSMSAKRGINLRFNESIHGQRYSLLKRNINKGGYRRVVRERECAKKRYASVNARKLALPNNSSYYQIVNFVHGIKNLVNAELSPIKSFPVSSRNIMPKGIILRHRKQSNLRSMLFCKRGGDSTSASISNPVHLNLPLPVEKQTIDKPLGITNDREILNVQENEEVFLFPDLRSHAMERRLDIAIDGPFYLVNFL
eukprot:TRINITY_DN3805_c0_g3_i1.p1 TRINITY_DN3805_c0_g3~~TRINITY_DN3805_c0_g3_i1.p1  ORF type:complete len:261 (-),score=21.53 TRINITY_DN3805_c0_g3_i1:141-923(-)